MQQLVIPGAAPLSSLHHRLALREIVDPDQQFSQRRMRWETYTFCFPNVI